MEDFPLWLFARISFCEVHEVSFDVDGYHELFVILDHGEWWVASVSTCSWSGDKAPSDWFRVLDRSGNIELLIMSVAERLESNNVLESLNDGMISVAKLMKTVPSWDVCYDVNESMVLFYLCELFLQPVELVSWISSIIKEPPVQVVASLHVDTNNSPLRVEFERLWVVTPLPEHLNLILTEPSFVSPALFKVVNCPVTVNLWKILNIHGPCVVVSLDWVDLNAWISP